MIGVDPFVRDAALKAWAFLAFDGRSDRTAFDDFLLRFDEDRLTAPDDDVMWHSWMSAVATLGVTALEQRVRHTFADGRIPQDWCGEDDFDEMLNAAIAPPNDSARLAQESMGYIDDVLVALEKFAWEDVAGSDDPEGTLPAVARIRSAGSQSVRDVGRNDPCP